MATKGWTQDDVDALLKRNGMTMPEPKPKRKPRIGKGAQVPNKTEQDYADCFLQGTDHRFQALTFQMKNGLSYTPDWIVFKNGVPVTAIECKGSYRFHSEGRAHLAFNQCAIEFDGFHFIWAKKPKEGWVHE